MSNPKKKITLSQLIIRGDHVAMVNGKLVITPKSKKIVPDSFYKDQGQELIAEIVKLLSINAYQYDSYTTGRYTEHKSAGVTLQFTNVITGKDGYCCFNANLNYVRGENKGRPLPKKKFRVGHRSNFYKFWKSTGLIIPQRDVFHDCMGKLKQFIYIGDLDINNRFSDKMLKTLNVSHEEIVTALNSNKPDKSPTTIQQCSDNSPTTSSYKESHQTYTPSTLDKDQSACASNYGIRLKGNTDKGNVITPIVPQCTEGIEEVNDSIPTDINPEDQTVDEWLDSYDNG